MATTKKPPIAISSMNDLLRSFLTDVPANYRYEPTRLQIYPIAYFLPFLRVPTPPNVAPFSYLILQKKGKGILHINADVVSIVSRGAMFVHRGSVVSLRSLHASTTGWLIIYDDSAITRILHPEAIERLMGLRSAIALSSEALDWMEHLCTLLERQLRAETADHQPVADHLFGALIERLLAEGTDISGRRVDRPESLSRQFRRLVFENALTEGSVGFYADKMNISENYLLRCVRRSSGRSPKDWIIDVRLMHAQTLLHTTDATVAEVASRTGFDDPSYFGRIFQRKFGMSPRGFRLLREQDLSE